jgi:hypothetical protein
MSFVSNVLDLLANFEGIGWNSASSVSKLCIFVKRCNGCFTLWLKVKRSLISTNHIAINQELGLSTPHTTCFHFSKCPWQYFLIKATDLGDLGQTRMETQTMVERLLMLFKIVLIITDKILAVDWRGFYGHGIKWDAPSSFGPWAWPLEASHYA